MTIIEALKTEIPVRISVGGRWLVWHGVYQNWVVYEHFHGKHISQILINTEDEEKAVEILLEGGLK